MIFYLMTTFTIIRQIVEVIELFVMCETEVCKTEERQRRVGAESSTKSRITFIRRRKWRVHNPTRLGPS